MWSIRKPSTPSSKRPSRSGSTIAREEGLEVPPHLRAVKIDGRDREPVAVIDRHLAQVEDPRLGLRVPRAVVEHVAAVLRAGLSQRLPQPGMVLGDVLDLLIQIDLHPSRVHRLHQLPVGGQVPVVPVHPFEARREIIVVERRRIDRREQDGRRAEVLDVSQLLGDAAQVADPVAVAVPEAADEDVIDDLVLRSAPARSPRSSRSLEDDGSIRRQRDGIAPLEPGRRAGPGARVRFSSGTATLSGRALAFTRTTTSPAPIGDHVVRRAGPNLAKLAGLASAGSVRASFTTRA